MKKFIVTLFALALLSVPAYAFEATVPQFEVWVNGVKLEHKNTEYPLLTYKDVTYFPMTYDYVHMLGLTNSWDNGEFHLSFSPGNYDWPNPEWAPEVKTIQGEIVSYPIYVNGKLIDNTKEEYPIFNARGITYFPLTWRFATEEFGMELIWDGRLAIDTGSRDRNKISRIVGDKVYFDYSLYDFDFLEDGTFSYTYAGGRQFVFDASEGTVESDDQKIQYDEDGIDVGDKMSIYSNDLLYNGVVIDDVSEIVAAEAQRGELAFGINVWGMEYDLGGGKSLLMTTLTYKYQFAIPHPTSEVRWYIHDGNNFNRLDFAGESQFAGAEYINGVRWLCMQEWSDVTSDTYRLFTVAADNTLVPVTDPDHENIELLGQIGGKPVVKATWQTENGGVSAVNDGYFTVGSDGSFNKIYPYVYCNDAFVINERLYLLILRNNTIIDVLADKEIKF